jgi:hypothetical protein
VLLKIYDNLGKELYKLVDQNLSAGIYETDFDAGNLGSGVYYYRISAGDFVQTKKMILIK